MGARLLLGDLNEAGVKETAEALGGEAKGVFGMRLDVADPQSVAAYTEAARTRFERLDVLVNNAGWDRIGLFIGVGWVVLCWLQGAYVASPFPNRPRQPPAPQSIKLRAHPLPLPR